jgi:hypothetical protein
LKNPRARSLGLFVVAVRVCHPHVHFVRDRIGGEPSLSATSGHDDRAVAEDKLGAMLADAKALSESKRAAEPGARLGYVVVCQHWDDSGLGH